MIYILAVFLPPLGLLVNGQPLSALLNLAIIIPCLLLSIVFPVIFFVPSMHAVVAIYMRRQDRQHQEIVNAVARRGAPAPGWYR
jgi:hypothetical protein